MTRYDFANILFAGPCNLRCPYCIGKQVDPALSRNNLNKFPLQNLNKYVELLRQHRVTEIVFTGTTTDPQLYRHEARLLTWLREQLPPLTNDERGIMNDESGQNSSFIPCKARLHHSSFVRYSLHTNGQLALRKMDVFNWYDRVCISFPSFKTETYYKMTGSWRAPNLAEIVRQAQVPIKISCIINEHNVGEVGEFLERCGEIGIKRLVFRHLYGDTREWPILNGLSQKGVYRNNPVYDYHGMEVTYWSFENTTSTSLNLFSDGTISTEYLLAKADPKAKSDKRYRRPLKQKNSIVKPMELF